VGIAYSADATCPSATAFLAQVRARAPRVDIVERRGAGARLSVLVKVDAKGALGRLDMHASDGTTTSREVRGDSCEGVVTALALVAALSASSDARAPEAASPQPPGAVDPGVPLAYRAIAAPSSLPESTDESPPREPPRTGADPSWRFGFGGGAGAIGGVAPDPAPFATAFVDLRRSENAVPLNFRLRAAVTFPAAQAYPWGTAEVRTITAGLQACPVAWSPVARLALLPCAGFEAGPLLVQGTVNERGGTSSQATWWWADATATARVEWAVASALHLELEGGALLPLTHNSYVVNNPETPIFSAPPATFTLLAGAMLQFP
jgi:hypothetical protein